MKKIISFTSSLGVLLFLNLILTFQSYSQTTATMPKMVVGDTAVYKVVEKKKGLFHKPKNNLGKITYKVIEANQDGSFILERKAISKGKVKFIHYGYNNKYQIVKTISPSTGKEKIRSTYSLKKDLDFPLSVGKKWVQSFRSKSVKGAYNHYREHLKVESVEKIAVPAGSFETFKIVGEQTNMDFAGNSNLIFTYWYSPKVKTIIKSEFSWRDGVVLDSYIEGSDKIAESIAPTQDRVKKIEHFKLSINSTPSAARVYKEGIYKGTTPLDLKIEQKSCNIDIRKVGYEKTSKRYYFTHDITDTFNLEKIKVSIEAKTSKNIYKGNEPVNKQFNPNQSGDGLIRTALLIGNNNYKSGNLKNPVNDATDMASLLKEKGFKVTLKTNVNQKNMEHAIRRFGQTLSKGGVGLFYFAGHGIQIKGRNYLIPTDAIIETQGDVKYETVDAGLVLAKMEDAENSLNIVILDACRNNPFARSFRSSTSGLAKMDAPKGSLIAYATAPGSLAADGEGRNGVYTKHLIQNIKKPGLKIEEVFKNVRVAVVSETSSAQVPWETSSLMGGFYFNTNPKKENIAKQIIPAKELNTSSYELLFWESIKDSNDSKAFELYLKKFPNGGFAELAEMKIQKYGITN